MSGRQPPSRAEEITLHIEDLASDGRGVARRADSKQVVFVPDALPGEQVRVRLGRRRKGVVESRLLQVELSSPDRVKPDCPRFGVCGGCALQHLSTEAQRSFKQKQVLETLRRVGKVTPEEVAPAIAGPGWAYRRRARLGVKFLPGRGEAIIGFRNRTGVRLAQLEACPILDARVSQCIPDLAALVTQLSIADQVPQIEVAAAAEVVLVIRVLSPPSPADIELLKAFERDTGMHLCLQSGGPDTITALSPPMPQLSYAPINGEMTLHFAPSDFVQINGEVSQKMVRQALDWLEPLADTSVLELFSGLGNFSVPLAARGARVHAVEGDIALVERARENARLNGVSIDVHQADLFQPQLAGAWLHADYDAVLLDPPRAGAREVLAEIAARGPKRIVYVSCHPGTLARDAGDLVHAHGYRLSRIGILDMFPHTAHVEAMALFERP